MSAHEIDELVGTVVGDASRCIVDVHDAVDDGAGVRNGILDDVADGIGCLVEEAVDVRSDLHGQGIVDHGGHLLRLPIFISLNESECHCW